jgi:hypothetical protein
MIVFPPKDCSPNLLQGILFFKDYSVFVRASRISNDLFFLQTIVLQICFKESSSSRITLYSFGFKGFQMIVFFFPSNDCCPNFPAYDMFFPMCSSAYSSKTC